MCGTEKTPSVKVPGDPHGTARTTFFSYVGSESVKMLVDLYLFGFIIIIYKRCSIWKATFL